MIRRIAGVAALAAAVSVAAPAAAHPEHYAQNAFLVAGLEGVRIELDLSPGERVAKAVAARIDLDGDRQLSDLEARRYAEAVASDVMFAVDGVRTELRMLSVVAPTYDALLTGRAELRVVLASAVVMSGEHRLSLRVDHAPIPPHQSAYTINAFSEEKRVSLARLTRGDDGRSMTVVSTGPLRSTRAVGVAAWGLVAVAASMTLAWRGRRRSSALGNA